MKMWEAILEGSKLTKQAFGRWVNEAMTATCALGAAMLVSGGLKQGYMCPSKDIRVTFPVGAQPRRCPLTECTTIAGGDVASTIAHLNDHHLWSREKIAYWLRDIEEPNWRDRITVPAILASLETSEKELVNA